MEDILEDNDTQKVKVFNGKRLSRIREEVSQESHKLQSLVRVQHPQPNNGEEASMVMQWTVNPPPSGTTGSIPVFSTKFRKCGRVRFIATVLKTVVSKGTVSSNLTVSAKQWVSDVMAA